MDLKNFDSIIHRYLEKDLIDFFELENISQQKKEEISDQVAKHIQNVILETAVAHFSKEDIEFLSNKRGAGDFEFSQALFETSLKYPDLQVIIQEKIKERLIELKNGLDIIQGKEVEI